MKQQQKQEVNGLVKTTKPLRSKKLNILPFFLGPALPNGNFSIDLMHIGDINSLMLAYGSV